MQLTRILSRLFLCSLFCSGVCAGNRVLKVGPGAEFPTPCQAFAAAQDGDTIEIDAAGRYEGDVCRIPQNLLTIRGVNGRPRIDASGNIAEAKGIWVIGGNDNAIENIELSGCKGPNQNGSGIRFEGTNLTVRGCYIHDNEDGILCPRNLQSEILIEKTEFARNGYGDGQSHNIYIGNIKKLTLRFCYSHHARNGHLVKSRAVENQILYNRLTDEGGGSSYELDLPNGGLAYVIGNTIQQSPVSPNGGMLAFGQEGPVPGSRLLVVHNTFVNDRDTGIFVQVQPQVILRSMLVNNIFCGPGRVCSQESALLLGNFTEANPGLLNPERYDYRLLPHSKCVNTAADLMKLGLAAVVPKFEYVHPCGSKPRTGETNDIGAYGTFARATK